MSRPGCGRLSTKAAGLAALAAFVLIATLGAWTPSHYGQAARLLGMKGVQPIIGGARAGRSDEWGVTTPYFQIAVAGDLGPVDVVSPYRTPLKAFFALPSRDWSMAFKPDLWGFLVLDPARAYALHYALLAAASLLGMFLLLRQLGARAEAAVAGSALLYFSQFVQLWWVNNAPVLGLAAWPAVVYLWRAPWPLRLPVTTYVVAAWLIGQLYPPLIIASGLALAVALFAFRPDALGLRRLLPGALAAAAGIGVAWLHYADLIPAMAATVYPGHRIANGGGVHLLQLVAHLFPYLVTHRYAPLGLWPSNSGEIAVVGSFLPVALACFCDRRAFVEWAGARRRALAVWATGLLLMLAWMLIPIPGRFAPGLNLVPPPRLIWGFGLLLTIGLVIAAGEQTWRLTGRRVAAFLLIAAAAWAVSKVLLAGTPVELDRFDLVVAPVLLLLLGLSRLRPRLLPPQRLVLAALVLTSLVTFGGFNPVQSAIPIFSPPTSPLLDAFRAYAAANPKGVVVAPDIYAATLNGAGVPAINHTLLRPETAFFRAAFPDLDEGAAQRIFNRYAHVQPELIWAPELLQADVFAVPLDPFAIPLPVDLPAGQQAAALTGGGVERAAATRLASGRWGVMVGGRTDWAGVSPDQRLEVWLDRGAGRIVSASAFRLPSPDPARFAAGFGLRLVIETPGEAPPPAGALRFGVVDRLGERRLSPVQAVTIAGPASVAWPKRP